jgi:hypothetical protein
MNKDLYMFLGLMWIISGLLSNDSYSRVMVFAIFLGSGILLVICYDLLLRILIRIGVVDIN